MLVWATFGVPLVVFILHLPAPGHRRRWSFPRRHCGEAFRCQVRAGESRRNDRHCSSCPVFGWPWIYARDANLFRFTAAARAGTGTGRLLTPSRLPVHRNDMFWRSGRTPALTAGLISGTRTITLAWVVLGTDVAPLADMFLASAMVAKYAAPTLTKWLITRLNGVELSANSVTVPEAKGLL